MKYYRVEYHIAIPDDEKVENDKFPIDEYYLKTHDVVTSKFEETTKIRFDRAVYRRWGKKL